LPAVADMQNTIIEEFEDDPNVVAVILNEGGQFDEDLDWVENIWDHFYLRGSIIWDPYDDVSSPFYDQPHTGLPFGRSFIIDQYRNAVTTSFGYNPSGVIDKIYELLAADQPATPNNFTISISGNDIILNWDSGSRDETYNVYSSTDPYLDFNDWNLEASGIINTTWTDIGVSNIKKFYIVTASE